MKFKMPEKPNISRRTVTVIIFAVTIPLALLCLIFGILFLCRVGDFRIVGETPHYTADQLIEASGIEQGERLYFINSAEAAENIKKAAPRLKNVKVMPFFFTTVMIEVEEEVPKYYSYVNGDYYLLSEDFRVLESANTSAGYKSEGAIGLSFHSTDIKKVVVGEYVEFADEKAENKITSFISEIKGMSFGDYGVTALGFENNVWGDAYIVLDGRLKIILGKPEDMSKKIFEVLRYLAESEEDFEFAEIMAIDINEISFRRVDSIE